MLTFTHVRPDRVYRTGVVEVFRRDQYHPVREARAAAQMLTYTPQLRWPTAPLAPAAPPRRSPPARPEPPTLPAPTIAQRMAQARGLPVPVMARPPAASSPSPLPVPVPSRQRGEAASAIRAGVRAEPAGRAAASVLVRAVPSVAVATMMATRERPWMIMHERGVPLMALTQSLIDRANRYPQARQAIYARGGGTTVRDHRR